MLPIPPHYRERERVSAGNLNRLNDSALGHENYHVVSPLMMSRSPSGFDIWLEPTGVTIITTNNPTTITGNTNNYSTGGFTNLQLTTNAVDYNITGFDSTGATTGQPIYITNTGSNYFWLTNQDASSTAANRIITTTGQPERVNPGQTYELIWDPTASRWRAYNLETTPINTTPTTITGNTNNYDLNQGTFNRISTDAAGYNLTGFDASNAIPGAPIFITNVGANSFNITNQDGASTAANRVTTPGGTTIPVAAGQTVMMVYDATTATWRALLLSTSLTTGGTAGGFTATENTGTTVDSPGVTVFDVLNNNGLHGVVAIKNTGGSNGLIADLTLTDFYGTSYTATTGSIGAGSFVSVQLDWPQNSFAIGGIAVPLKEVKLVIYSASPGNSTTYDIWRSINV